MLGPAQATRGLAANLVVLLARILLARISLSTVSILCHKRWGLVCSSILWQVSCCMQAHIWRWACMQAAAGVCTWVCAGHCLLALAAACAMFQAVRLLCGQAVVQCKRTVLYEQDRCGETRGMHEHTHWQESN